MEGAAVEGAGQRVPEGLFLQLCSQLLTARQHALGGHQAAADKTENQRGEGEIVRQQVAE